MVEDLKNSLKNIKIFDLDGYKRIKTIGSGSFGEAILAQKESNYIVIKKFFDTDDPKTLESIKREILNQSECHKENIIVSFLGISFVDFEKSPNQIPWLIIEYEEGGSLTKLDKSKIDDVQKMIIIYGIAKGIQFLHQMKICHRDLNPNNIVLNSLNYPLICDFGSSRQISTVHIDDGTYTGTPIYQSPEMFNDDITTDFFFPTDIFSFGTIIYNLITNENPYEKDIKKLNFVNLANFLQNGNRINLPSTIPSWFRYLITLCWKQNPKERPTIDDIVNLFDAGIALPLIYDEKEKSQRYFSYLQEYLHLYTIKFNEKSLLDWCNSLLIDGKNELALVINFMLADYFNDSESQTKLGYNFFNGYLLEKNIVKSKEYFSKAARQNNPKSLFYLSEMCRFGYMEHSNDSVNYLRQSAQIGYEPAIYFLNKINEYDLIKDDNSITIIVTGDDKVGKTSFINNILREIHEPLLFSSDPVTNYYVPLTLNRQQKIKVCIQDTTSYDSLINHLDDIKKNMQLVICIFDLTNDESFANIDKYVNLFNTSFKFMFLGNKTDKENKVVSHSAAKSKAQNFNACYYEMSTLKSINTEVVRDEIVSYFTRLESGILHDQIMIKRYQTSPNSDVDHKKRIKAIVLGRYSCGKTSFIYYLKYKIFGQFTMTYGIIPSFLDLDIFSLYITDTCGNELYIHTLVPFMRTLNLFIIMYDITNLESFNSIDIYYSLIVEHVASQKFNILIFGNKEDLNDCRAVSVDKALEKAKSLNAGYVEISCKTGFGIDNAIDSIKRSYIDDSDDNNGLLVSPLSDREKKCNC